MNWRTHAIDHLLLVLVCCAWGANCAENSSDRDAGYCDDSASCAVGREHTVIKKPAASNEWKPFVTEGSRSRWYDFGKVLKVYSKWHNRTLYDSSIKCSEKKALVFTPNAGLGDSIGAMTSAFIIAIKQGRSVKKHFSTNKSVTLSILIKYKRVFFTKFTTSSKTRLQ